MRRKRRNRSTWFPVLPTVITQGDDTEAVTWTQYLDILSAGSTFSPVSATPITLDFTQNPDNVDTGTSLRDVVEGQSFLLERIVGSVFANRIDNQFGTTLACAAIAVFPADDNGGADLSNAEGNPLLANNSQQPWLWRRVWYLNGQSAAGSQVVPTTNINFGSVKEGTHIDTKGSRRMIRREQRLFFVTVHASPNGDNTTDKVLEWTYDLRLIGKMVRQVNRSTFK